MRLLERNNDGEFTLTKDIINNIPHYAILSHTWGADTEEVTFRDLTDSTGKDKAGYDKIRFCGEQAMRDGLQYFWIDTCCIDKSNNTEVSEAINSMFRWYRDAAKCYVYLSDVSIKKRKARTQLSEFTWEPALRKSRWFTRAWTLQELLAPSSVEFFSQEGKRIGDKKNLERQVHEITGIAIPALQGAPLSQFEVDERFSWAKDRQATREEDKAYSLLGIFGAYIPLIYGEGYENAFRRLREDIDRRIPNKKITMLAREDIQSVANAVSALHQSQQVVESQNKDTLNRLSPLKYELTQIDNYRQRHAGSLNWFLQRPEYQKWLTERGSTLFCPGIPGAGKTVLAATVIQDLHDRISSAKESIGIACVYFRFKERPNQTAINVIGSICAQFSQSQDDVIEEARNLHRKAGNLGFITEESLLQLLTKSVGKYERSYLVIDALDEFNVDDIAWMPLLDAIREFAPQLHILVTSRPHVRFDYRFAQALKIDIIAQDRDLLDYVRVSLEHPALHRHLVIDEKLKSSIEEAVVRKSQGMFLVTKLHMFSLQRKARYSKKALLDAVAGLPNDLDEIYHDTIQRIDSQDKDDALLAKQVLAWTHHSYAFLSPRALQQAIAQHRGDDPESEDCLIDVEFLVTVCFGLVTIDEESQVIRLVHYTLEEYLDHCFDDLYPSARRELHISCLRYSLDSSQLSNVMKVRNYIGSGQWWYDELTQQREECEERNRLHSQNVPFSAYALFHIDVLACIRETGNLGADKSNFSLPHDQKSEAVQYASSRYSPELEVAHVLVLARDNFDIRAATFLNDAPEVRRILNSDNNSSSAALSACLAYACFSGYNSIVETLLHANADVRPMFTSRIYSVEAYWKSEYNCLGFSVQGINQVAVKLILNRYPDLVTQPVCQMYDKRNSSVLEMIEDLICNGNHQKMLKEIKATIEYFLADR